MLTNLLLGGMLMLLVAIVALLWRRDDTYLVELNVRPEIEASIQRLATAARHYGDVSAVVEMVRQLDADPDAAALIQSYPQTVRAAAWLHYINVLGATLHSLQEQEAMARQRGFVGSADEYRQQVVNVREQLDAAIAASGQSGGLRSV